jgi:hypothetical protein
VEPAYAIRSTQLASINSKHEKVTGQSTGKTGNKKREGYAATSPHVSMIGTKPGKTSLVGYTGPSVAQGTHNG